MGKIKKKKQNHRPLAEDILEPYTLKSPRREKQRSAKRKDDPEDVRCTSFCRTDLENVYCWLLDHNIKIEHNLSLFWMYFSVCISLLFNFFAVH